MTILCASSLNDRPLRNRSPSGKSFDPKWRSGRNVISVLMDIAMGVEVSEIGDLHRGRPYACNFALVYTGVIVFGPVNIQHHYCPVKSRTESIGCRDRVSRDRSRMGEVPVQWAFSRKE